MAEYRVSIYGRKQSEWDQLASWFINNELYSENVVWLIQVTCYVCVCLSSCSSHEQLPLQNVGIWYLFFFFGWAMFD